MANGKHPKSQPDVFPQPWPSDKNRTEICKPTKYAAPHACAQTQQSGGKKEQREGRCYSQPWAFPSLHISGSCSHPWVSGDMDTPQQTQGFLRAGNCLPVSIRETPQRTNNPTPTFCAYLGKYFKQEKKKIFFLQCEISYNYDNCKKKKLYGQNLGAAGRILWCLNSNLTPTEFWEWNEPSLSHTPQVCLSCEASLPFHSSQAQISQPWPTSPPSALPDTLQPQPECAFLYSFKHGLYYQ